MARKQGPGQKHYNDYMVGLRAFADGKPEQSCPHPQMPSTGFNERRYEWMAGWYDGAYPQRKYDECQSAIAAEMNSR